MSAPLKLTLPHQSGPEVEELQKFLGLHGHSVEIDGVLGHSTDRAIREFQRSKNLPITGEVDPATSFLLFGGIRLGGPK